MGFEVFLQADPTKTERLPPASAVEDAFAGRILRRDPRFGSVAVGTEDDCSDLYFDTGAPIVDHMLVSRPTTSIWLWDALYRLMDDYDMFLYWPGERLIAAMARPDVPLPDGMPAEPAVVGSGEELRTLVEQG